MSDGNVEKVDTSSPEKDQPNYYEELTLEQLMVEKLPQYQNLLRFVNGGLAMMLNGVNMPMKLAIIARCKENFPNYEPQTFEAKALKHPVATYEGAIDTIRLERSGEQVSHEVTLGETYQFVTLPVQLAAIGEDTRSFISRTSLFRKQGVGEVYTPEA